MNFTCTCKDKFDKNGTMTKICYLKEASSEHRASFSLDAVTNLSKLGLDVHIQSDAGKGIHLTDAQLKSAGATIQKTVKDLIAKDNVFVSINTPDAATIDALPAGSTLVCLVNPAQNKDVVSKLAKNRITTFALELIPRISRAQNMDVLSSQANLAGYRAVIESLSKCQKVFPMMMTAAGKVSPAKVLILGAGVAGLQAIATAKRMGAVVSAFDVRSAVKEQVESLGAKFVEVEQAGDSETKGGYAKELSEKDKKAQAEKIAEVAKEQDVIITTALIPGRPAPELVTEAMVKSMKPGSVIVDLAAANGGNCKLSEADKTVTKHGVIIVGDTHLLNHVAVDASALFAKNVFNFISHLYDAEKKKIEINLEDEITSGTLLTYQGKVVHPNFKDTKVKEAPKKPAVKKAPPKTVTSQKPHLKKKTAASNKKKK